MKVIRLLNIANSKFLYCSLLLRNTTLSKNPVDNIAISKIGMSFNFSEYSMFIIIYTNITTIADALFLKNIIIPQIRIIDNIIITFIACFMEISPEANGLVFFFG